MKNEGFITDIFYNNLLQIATNMKRIIYFAFYVLPLFTWAQQIDHSHQQMVHRERANALSRMLRQPLANTGNYDVKFHRLELTISSMNSRNLSGTVTTYFVPNQNISTIEFDFTDAMNVQSVTQRGTALTFSQSNNKLIINFSGSQANGVLDSLSITYNGNVPSTGLDSYVLDQHAGVPIIWTLSEPYGAKDWWPCKQDLIDKADSVDVVLHYPASVGGETMIGVSNGLLTSESTSGGVKTSVWKHRYPIAAYLVAFAITNYTKFSQTAGLVQHFPIDNYTYPENLTGAQGQSVDFLPVMNYFEQSFGHYPFNLEKYGQIQFGWGGGMEHQTATFVVSFDRGLIAHELAHQWFGDAITCGSWHDIWLNEGFATYSEGLTREALDGTTAFDTWKQNTIDDITASPAGSVYVQDTTNINRIFDWRLSYQKGAMLLNMLRLKTGDANFFQGLKNYVNHKSFQYASINDFRSEMEAASGLSLVEFFNDWYYGQGYPTYTINVNRTGLHQYDVEVNQTSSFPGVSFFEMPLPFKFTDNQGHEFKIKLDNTTNGQHFTVDPGFDATQVSFDPHFDIIKGHTTLNQNLGIAALESEYFKVFPNPANDVIRIKNKTEITINEVSIITTDGKIVKTIKGDIHLVPVTDLPRGLYILHIASDKTDYYQNIILE